MIDRLFAIGRPAAVALGFLCAGLCAGAAGAAEIMTHRALYTMTLGRASSDAGITGASGTMAYQWGESCDGWTVEQRYRLRMGYAESADVNIASNFVTWESKDGLRYRFNQKETRNGADDEEIRGDSPARRARPGRHRRFRETRGQELQAAGGRAVSERAHDLPDRPGRSRREFHLEARLRRRDGGERGAGLGGDRRQSRARSRGGQEKPAAEPAGLACAAGLLPGRSERGNSPITSSACCSWTTASRATW